MSALTAARDISTMVGRETRRTLRGVDALVTAFVIPVGIMVVFVVVFGGALGDDAGYVNYVVPGVLVLCLGFGSATTTITVAQDMTSGTIDRFKTMGIMRSSPLWGHVIASILRSLATSVLVVAVALALGFRPGAQGIEWLGVVAYAVLVVLAFTWVCCAAGLVLSVDAAGTVGVVFLFAPYLSSGFVSVETMPTWLQGFAQHQPFTPIIEAMRALLSGGDAPGTVLAALLWLLGMLVVSYAAAAWVFGRRTAR